MTETTDLRTETSDNTLTVTDPQGGVWWPDAEATAEIEASDDPEATAIKIATDEPMRGEWRQ